jgi:dolichyl-diphosphooligosaccharide---protein glycosyltransferase
MLEGSKTLFHKGIFDFKIKHLLVIGVLALAFATGFIMRSYPVKYGFYLNEFDPYFDYRATKYIVDHGLNAYWKWQDMMSWYPEGRDVPKTSQSGLHIVSAYLYEIFGAGSSLLDFTILLPVILGSLTTIVIFALVRTLGNTTAGMFSALLFAFTPAIIQRGNLGWFKSEPLGLFFGLLAVYLLISAIKHKQLKYAIPKAVLGGLLLGLGNASWGGVQYFSIPISLFFIALPFFQRNTRVSTYVVIAFTLFSIASAGAFPRPGISFILGLPGIALIGGTIFMIGAEILKRISSERNETRNLLFLLGGFVVVGLGVVIAGAYHPASFRYLNAINPFLSSQNPLTASVAEHFTPTLVDYFTNYSILLMFAGIGIWVAFRYRTPSSIFALIIGITAIYVSATFARLLVFASIGIIVLAGLGLYEITRSFMSKSSSPASSRQVKFGKMSKGRKFSERSTEQPAKNRTILIGYTVLIIFLLTIPMVYPQNSGWLSLADIPPSIANGGTGYKFQTNDWLDTLAWMSTHTPKRSVIASWWDYGYWITTLANRTSIADNATINQTRIATIAKMFMDKPDIGAKVARELKADYVLVYIVAQRFAAGNGSSIYALGNGGDESKKQWFIRIGGFNESTYLEQDGVTPTPTFWNSTLLGKMIPFTPQFYASSQNGRQVLQPTYTPGSFALYTENIKYPQNETKNQPFSLVYASPSFRTNTPGLVFAVLVYKVNHDYVPNPISGGSNPQPNHNTNLANHTNSITNTSRSANKT